MNTPNDPEQSISQQEPPGEMAVDTAKNGDLKETKHSSDDKEITADTRVEADGTLEDQLLAAALNGKKEVVQDLLKKDGININARDEDGKTALHLASQRGHKQVAQELLKTSDETGNIKGFLNARDHLGRTALHLALQSSYMDVVQELLKTSERIGILNGFLRSKDLYKRTAFHIASMIGHKQVVQELLSIGDRTGTLKEFLIAKDGTNRTVLHLALERGHEEVVQELLKAGERTGILNEFLSSKDLHDRTAFHIASMVGRKQVVQELLKIGDRIGTLKEFLMAKDEANTTALHLASKGGHNEVVQELLKTSEKIGIINKLLNSKDGYNRTALHFASIHGHKEVVEELLNTSYGKEIVNDLLILKDADERSALHLASENGHKEVVQELLRANKSLTSDLLDLKDEEGRTALHIACAKGSEEIVKMLLSNGAIVNFESANKDTPLMEAIWNSNEFIVALLLDHGASPRTRSENYSALTAACYCPKTDQIVKYLLNSDLDINEKDPDGWAPIHTACWKKSEANLAVVKLLLDRNADLEAQNSSNKTPLHLALESGDQEITRLILEKTENIEIEDEEGLTPLHVAAQQQNAEAIGVLIKKSANLEAKDKKSCTPLHHAIRRKRSRGSESSCKSIVELLLNNYAPIDASEADGETPLHWATVYGGLEIVQLILRHNPNVDASDHSKETALHKVHECLVKEDRRKITEELLKKADIGAKCDKGQTALHKASEAGCTEVVKVLLDQPRGKEFINSPDDSSLTPLHLASMNGHGDTIEVLLRHGADVETRIATTPKELDLTALPLAMGSLLRNETEDDKKNSKAAISHIAKKSTEAIKRNALYRAQLSLETEDQLNSVLEAMKPSDDRGDTYPKQSDLEQTEFIWCAIEPERHPSLLRKLKAKANPLNKDEAGLEPEEDSVLQWAAYHGYYVVVYWLLRKSESKPKDDEAKNREKAIEIANYMLQRAKNNEERVIPPPVGHNTEADGQTKQKKKVVQSVPGNNERTQNQAASSSPNKEIQRFHHTLDMLRDPPIGTDNDATSGDCKAPSLRDKSDKKNISWNYEATIVDFYSRGPRVDLFRRQRPIYDVIYETDNGGPDGVMKMATSILKDVNPGVSLETENDRKEGGLGLRWIHLPANNLEWMEHLVQRVCHDGKQSEGQHAALRDFLRGSWREMPLGDSSAKFMNPRFVTGRRKNDPLNKGNDEGKDEQEPEMDHDGQEDNDTFKDQRDVEKTQQSRVPKSYPVHALEFDSMNRQQTPAALYMPYLTFEKCYRQQCECQQEIPDPGEFRAKCDSMIQVYNKHGARRQVVHTIRSLDEFYYPNLPDLARRNAGQVATRYLTDKSQGNRKEVGDWWPIIAVGQLWLWIIDEKTIISSSTSGYCGKEDPVVEGIFNQLREQMEQGGSSSLPSTVYQLSRLIVKYCINFTKTATWKGITRELKVGGKYTEKLQEQQESLLRLYGDKSPFEIFAESINRVANAENDLFENFVNQVERNKNESKRDKNNDKTKEKTKSSHKTEPEQSSQDKSPIQQNRCSHNHNTAEDNSEARYANETDDTKQTSEHEDWEAIFEAANLLREVKDIQDELHMLKAVVADQESVWKTITGQRDNSRRRVENNSIMERGPADILEELEEMTRLVDSIETSVKDTLNLEQNGINITEATISRQLTEQSMRQGRSIMAFTVVTIFFLPMSFLTSMFALNVSSFQHDASGNLFYQPAFIFPIIFFVSIPFGAIIIIIALFFPKIEELWRSFWNGQHKQLNMRAHFEIFQNTVNSRSLRQDSANQTSTQTANIINDLSKGTEASSKPLESYLRNFRSSLRSRRKSKIVDTEKGIL